MRALNLLPKPARYECEVTQENADDGIYVARLYFPRERRVMLGRTAGYTEDEAVSKMREQIAWWDSHPQTTPTYPRLIELP